MKFSRRPLAHSARASHRGITSRDNGGPVHWKCPTCGQDVDASMARSLGRANAAVSANPADGLEKRSSNAIDPEKLLHFTQQLYAHALTLQEVIRNGGGISYEALRPRYERQAAQQFEVFRHGYECTNSSRKLGASAGE